MSSLVPSRQDCNGNSNIQHTFTRSIVYCNFVFFLFWNGFALYKCPWTMKNGESSLSNLLVSSLSRGRLTNQFKKLYCSIPRRNFRTWAPWILGTYIFTLAALLPNNRKNGLQNRTLKVRSSQFTKKGFSGRIFCKKMESSEWIDLFKIYTDQIGAGEHWAYFSLWQNRDEDFQQIGEHFDYVLEIGKHKI